MKARFDNAKPATGSRRSFAAVISIVIVLAGGVAVGTLPIAQYPEITPPTVRYRTYPGANARSWPIRSPPRSSSRSTASRACCTCRRSAPTTARTT